MEKEEEEKTKANVARDPILPLVVTDRHSTDGFPLRFRSGSGF
jgi:hypothetical protein